MPAPIKVIKMTEEERQAFNEFGAQVKALRLKDAAAIEIVKEKTEEWKAINKELTEKVKDFDDFVSSLKNAVTKITE